MKKYLIVIAALLAVIMLAALIAVIAVTRTIPSGDEDSLYDYGYRIGGGWLEVRITGEHEANTAWKGIGGALTEILEKKATDKKCVFRVTPENAGQQTARFLLSAGGEPEDIRYEITVTFRMDPAGKISVVSCGHRAYDGVHGGTDGDGRSYSFAENEAGEIRLVLKLPAEELWSAEIAGDSPAVSILSEGTGGGKIEKEEEQQGAREYSWMIRPLEAGDAEVVFFSEKAGASVRLNVTAAQDRITVREHGFAAYRKEPSPIPAEITEKVGALRLPDDAVFRECKILTTESDGKEYEFASLIFDAAGQSYVYLVMPGAEKKVHTDYYAMPEKTPEPLTLGSITAEEYRFAEGVMIFWREDAAGRTCSLVVRGADPEPARQMARFLSGN